MSTTPNLLHYRPWRGKFHGPWYATWALARSSLGLMLRRRLFWWLYGLSVLIFLFFFYGQYLQVWLEQKVTEESVRVGGIFPRNIKPDLVLKALRNALQLNGTGDTYANLIWFEGYIVVVIMALIGSVIVGNDFRFQSLSFYLAKPIGRRHYLGGKLLAMAIFINLMTTGPALVLYIEYGFIDSADYWFDHPRLLFGIFGYGAALTITLSTLLLATAIILRRTAPMVMAWTTIFLLGRVLQRWLVDGLHLTERWRLIDLWNDIYLVGQWSLGTDHAELRPKSQIQPAYHEACIVILLVSMVALFVTIRQVRAVEVVA